MGEGLFYQDSRPSQLYSPHLEISLSLIDAAVAAAGGVSASIIDVGGGESTLVDDLLARGYQNITVLDISQTAIDVTRARLKAAAEHVHWVIADVTKADLVPSAATFGTTGAVFPFSNVKEQRVAYVRTVGRAVRQGGHCDC